MLEWNWQSVTKLNWVKNAIMQATYFFVILFYTERIWLLMRNLVTILPKLSRKFQHFNTVDRSIKILKNSWIFKNNNENEKFKIFCKAQTASRLKKIIQPLPSLRLLNKTLLRLWNWTKILLRRYMEICRHLLSMCLKNAVLGCQEMVQYKYFFWHCTETCLLKICTVRKVFGCVCGSILFSMSSELRFAKWVRYFEQNCIVKCVIFFASFCQLWNFLLENLKLK